MVIKWHDTVLVTRWGLRPPNVDGKPVLGTDDLLVLQTFNLAYDDTIFPSERHRIQLLGCYLLLAFTGARPGEIVDNEKKKPKDGSWQDIYGRKTIGTEDSDDGNKDLDEADRLLEEMLFQKQSIVAGPKHFVMRIYSYRLCDIPKLVRMSRPCQSNLFIIKVRTENLNRK